MKAKCRNSEKCFYEIRTVSCRFDHCFSEKIEKSKKVDHFDQKNQKDTSWIVFTFLKTSDFESNSRKSWKSRPPFFERIPEQIGEKQ